MSKQEMPVNQQAMSASKRDDSLDILKGIGCIAMVIAHQPYIFQNPNAVLGLINHIAGIFPPAIFFSVSGITAGLQASKYTFRSLALYFGALFLIGFSWNIIIHGDGSAFYWPEIFQIIAMGSLLVCFIERKRPASQSRLLFISVCLLLLKPLVNYFWPHIDGMHLFLPDRDYIPELEADPKRTPLLPGFPLLPWTGFFFLGLWCYRTRKRQKLFMALLALGLALLSVALGSSATEKWNSSIAYIFSNCTVIFALLWLFSNYSRAHSIVTEQLRKLGSNAFLFFFSHPVGLVAGVIVYLVSKNAYIAWAVSIVVAVLIYNLLDRIQPWRIFASAYAWLFMIALIIFLPFLPQLIDHKSLPIVTRLLAVVIGIIAAVNFSALAALTKARKQY